MSKTSQRVSRSADVLISRLLIGKPDATPGDIRNLVPETRHMNDRALRQKIEFLKRRTREKAPARPR